MAAHDLLIRGGTVVDSSGATAADIAVDGQRISAVLSPNTPIQARHVINAHSRYVLPGLIDTHVHFRTPGLAWKETWSAGSHAAVAGGVTTVIDMPNTRPPLVTSFDAQEKHRLIEGTSLVDYRFHGGVDPTRIEAAHELTRAEASSIKVFLSGHHTAPDIVRDVGDLQRLFEIATELQRPLLFHAEDDSVFEMLDMWRGAPQSYHDYEPHRPRTAGIVAVARLIELARRHNTQVHVLHVSSQEEVDLLTAAASAGLPVSFEVTGHHLTFTNTDIAALESRIRLRPAIRHTEDRERLWNAVLAGDVATIGSDHSPHTLEEKSRSIPDAPPGLPGVQELFPTVYTGLLERRPDHGPQSLLPLIVRLLAEHPARLFGIDHRKGTIRAGMDADLVVFDPNRDQTLNPGTIQSLCGWSAYTGRPLRGTIENVLRRGATVAERTGANLHFGTPSGVWLDAS